jgi:hypothetical protein
MKEVINMAKALKIKTDAGNSYTVKVINEDDNLWGAFFADETTPAHTFTAPLDASKEEISSELDFIELTLDMEVDTEDMFADDDDIYA